MKLKTILLMGAAAVGGIYLTSEEGKAARKSIQKKKTVLMPAIKELITEANLILEGSKEIKSDEVKANIQKILNEVKISLSNLDIEKAFETSKKAIKVASNKINDVSNQVDKAKKTTTKSKAKRKTTVKAKQVSKTTNTKQTVKKTIKKK